MSSYRNGFETGPHASETARTTAIGAADLDPELLELALDASGIGLWTADLATDTVQGDARLLRMHGIDPACFRGTAEELRSRVPAEDRERIRKEIREALEGERGLFRCDYRVEHPDGAVRWLRVRGRAVPGASGRPASMVGFCEDLTDQHLAREHLRESERHIRMIAGEAPVMIWVSGADGLVEYFSPPWLEFRGRRLEEERGLGWAEGIHPDDRERVRAAFRASAASGGEYTCEYRLRRHDGEYRWVLDRARPRLGPEGELLGHVGSTVDIQELHEAQQRADRLAAVAARTTNAVLITDARGRCEWVNAAFERTTGHPAAEIVGLEPWALLCGERGDRRLAAMREEVRAQRAFEAELPCRTRHGRELWLSIDAQPRTAEGGRFGGYLIVATDVTARREAQAALRASEQRYRTLLSAMSQVVWVADEEGRFVTQQPAWQAYTGQSWEQHRGTGWISAVHPEDRSRVLESWSTAVRSGAAYEATYRLWSVRHRGYRHVQARAAPVPDAEEGGAVEWVGACTDVHDRVSAEERLQAALHDLERTNQDLERFAYAASHDLQQPLRAMSGFARLLQLRYAGKLDEEADRALAYIVEGADRQQRLIEALLEFSRAGRLKAPLELVRLDAALDDALHALRQVIEDRGAVVLRGPLPVVRADAAQMIKLLQNLVHNAVKFVPAGDRPIVRVTAERLGDAWLVRVADNGIGVPDHDRGRVFEPFTRLGLEGSVEGSGIGLSSCRRIVEAHRGRIWIEASEQGGACVCFALPAGEPEEDAPPP